MNHGSHISIDLTLLGEQQYRFAPCNRLWLPKTLIIGSGIVMQNSEGVELGIKIGAQGSTMLPWSIQDGWVTSASGAMSQIWVTVISAYGQERAYLSSGTDVGLGYGNADGLSPTVYSGSGGAGDSLRSSQSVGGTGGVDQ